MCRGLCRALSATCLVLKKVIVQITLKAARKGDGGGRPVDAVGELDGRA